VTPEDARKLIGGYATGNLADEERKALFAAALSKQELFDELVKEQALKELLDDPRARQRLLDQLQSVPERISGGAAVWRRAAAGSLALATVMIAVVTMRVPARPKAAPVLTATRLPAPAAPPIAAPIAPPAELLRDSVRQMAPKPENKVAAAAPVAALSEQVDAMAKSKVTNQAAAGKLAKMDAGLRYRILRRDASGVFTEAAADTAFDAGDAVRVRVETPAAGILSLSAGGELLASLAVEPNQVYVLPADRPITVDAVAGGTRLILALSPRAGLRERQEKKAEESSSAGSATARTALSVEIVLRHR
jgi:predicted secreted protein